MIQEAHSWDFLLFWTSLTPDGLGTQQMCSPMHCVEKNPSAFLSVKQETDKGKRQFHRALARTFRFYDCLSFNPGCPQTIYWKTPFPLSE
jgi:hypothetical protein